MELNIYKNRKISTTIGILELSNFYFLIKLFVGLVKSIPSNLKASLPLYFKLSPILQSLLVISIFITGFLYLFNKIEAYFIYFGQIIFRFIFCMPTLGLLLKINYFVKNATFYKVLVLFTLGMDLVRLVFTILILRKSRGKNELQSK